MATFPSNLVYQLSLVGCHRTTLILVCIRLRKSKSEIYWKLKVQVSFEKKGWDLTYGFNYFCVLVAKFFVTDILFS